MVRKDTFPFNCVSTFWEHFSQDSKLHAFSVGDLTKLSKNGLGCTYICSNSFSRAVHHFCCKDFEQYKASTAVHLNITMCIFVRYVKSELQYLRWTCDQSV